MAERRPAGSEPGLVSVGSIGIWHSRSRPVRPSSSWDSPDRTYTCSPTVAGRELAQNPASRARYPRVQHKRAMSAAEEVRPAGRFVITPPRSDLQPHGDDRLGDEPQAGVVVAGVRAHQLVGLIEGDGVLLGGDPFGLLNDDP